MSDWQLKPTELAALPARVLVFGAMGQVGRAACKTLGMRAQAVSREACNLAKASELQSFLESARPVAIFNAAAYTAVDKAEEDYAHAFAVNTEAPRIMAEYAAAHRIPMVHFSTDYVYSGDGESPHTESTPIAPLNNYGKSKAEGDKAVAESGCDHLIFRTSWVYDGLGNNFLRTMLRHGAQKLELSVVDDQLGAPSYAGHLAVGACKALAHAMHQDNFPSGVYHLVNKGCISWYEFANAIFKEARARGVRLTVETVQPIASSAYPTPAARPKNSRLSTNKIKEQFDLELPEWRDGLSQALDEFVDSQDRAITR